MNSNAFPHQRRKLLTLETEKSSRQNCRAVRVDIIFVSAFSSHTPAVKRGWIDTALGVGGILADVAMEASDAFGPLKATLGVISAIHESYGVRLWSFMEYTTDGPVYRGQWPSKKKSKTSTHA